MSDRQDAAIERLTEEFNEKAKEHHQKAKDASIAPMEAEQYAWSDALDWAASRLRQEVLESNDE